MTASGDKHSAGIGSY